MKNRYESPNTEIVYFNTKDVIICSGGGTVIGGDGEFGGDDFD